MRWPIRGWQMLWRADYSYGSDPNDLSAKATAAAKRRSNSIPRWPVRTPYLGLQQECSTTGTFPAARPSSERRWQLDPSDATAHQWFSSRLASIGGRPQQAIDEANRARQLDPLSPIMAVAHMAQAYVPEPVNLTRRSRVATKLIATIRPLAAASRSIGAYAIGPRTSIRQAIQESNAARPTGGRQEFHPSIAAALDAGFRSGRMASRASARPSKLSLGAAQGQDRLRFSLRNRGSYTPIPGDKDHAFEWLNTAYQEHDSGLIAIRTDFTLDSLRSDPRYAELVRKIGLPQ